MPKIMIVDDSRTDRAACLEALRADGYKFIEFSNGADCLRSIHRETPDLIILDVIMPERNGYYVCRALNRDPVTKEIPIILLTSKNQEADKFWGLKQGANAYLTKPVDPEELQKTVVKLLA